MPKSKLSKRKTCVICNKRIRTMVFKGTGVCSGKCQSILRDEHD